MSRLLISTDLDGTLLDHHTYSAAAAMPALDELRQRGIPCILNTSKTLAELEQLRHSLDHRDAFIVENGAAVYIPKSIRLKYSEPLQDAGEFWCKSFGPSRSRVIDIIQELRDGFRFRGFADMSVAEVVELTGLSEDDARLAMRRQFTEPLLWQDSPAALKQFALELADMDLQVQRGGRFAHVMGLTDKATAMLWLAERYATSHGEAYTTMALGDGQNDVGMLSRADIAVVVRSLAHPPPRVPDRADVWLTEHFGPEGWAEAVYRVLKMPL